MTPNLQLCNCMLIQRFLIGMLPFHSAKNFNTIMILLPGVCNSHLVIQKKGKKSNPTKQCSVW